MWGIKINKVKSFFQVTISNKKDYTIFFSEYSDVLEFMKFMENKNQNNDPQQIAISFNRKQKLLKIEQGR